MTTAYITIGNSDDKLTQNRWSHYVVAVDLAVRDAVSAGAIVHFHGFSPPSAPWQNAMWVVELPADVLVGEHLRSCLRRIARAFYQTSIAWATTEKVEFLAGT